IIISLVFFAYCLHNTSFTKGKKTFVYIREIWFVVLAFGLSSLQLIPLFEAYRLSARDAFMTELFHKFQFAPEHLITLFAPDFFGNPATLNFWGKDYGEFMLYIGVVVLFFAVAGVFYGWKNLVVRWTFGLGIIGLL